MNANSKGSHFNHFNLRADAAKVLHQILEEVQQNYNEVVVLKLKKP